LGKLEKLKNGELSKQMDNTTASTGGFENGTLVQTVPGDLANSEEAG
jgi:hypothetical protein